MKHSPVVHVPVVLTGWVSDDPQPGLVRAELVDAAGRRHLFVEKVAVLTDEALGAAGPWPRRGTLAGRVVAISGVVRVDSAEPWGVVSLEGEALFDVDTLALGPVDIDLPSASDPSCSFLVDLAALTSATTQAEAAERFAAAWHADQGGRLDVDVEADAVAVTGGRDAVVRAAALVARQSGRPVADADVQAVGAVLRALRRPRALPWRVGDVFAVPLTDGSWAFGQVLWEQDLAAGSGLRAPTCALLEHRAAALDVDLLDALTSRTLAILHVASDHLDRGRWRVVGHHDPVDDPFRGPHGRPGHGATSWDGLQELAEAWHGLAPWNAWAVPYEGALVRGVEAPRERWLLTPDEIGAWRSGSRWARGR
ncbi:MAG: hypothetical protein H6736_00100 [Alphaproteobacteria bacterium]|nr:hypothetical protein [Alphaproteobacteria bacterium]MCB9690193.1 hypothetical protein [Alphaproteobacteria bacterium]